MHYGKKHDLPFGIMDVAGLLRLNIRRRAPGQVYVDCPICGDRRGKMNLNTEKDLWRCNYCGEGGGMLSLYAKVYGVSNSDAYREICDALAVNGFSPDYTVPEKTAPTEAEQSDAASVQEVHQTLSMLLSMLTLIPAHREHLRSVRGLSDDEITRFGFKSTPPPFLCRSLTNRLVKAGCRVQGVPGFYVDDNGCWTVKFHQRTSGIIIPIFGVDGLIRGAQIRLDHPLKDKDDPPEKTGVKYLTLSSTGKRMGTTSGSPIHFVGDPCSRVVYVTEGCLKADVAHALMVWTGWDTPCGMGEALSVQQKIQRTAAQYPAVVCYCFDPSNSRRRISFFCVRLRRSTSRTTPLRWSQTARYGRNEPTLTDRTMTSRTRSSS